MPEITILSEGELRALVKLDGGLEITESILITETGPEGLADMPRELLVKD